MAKLMYGKTPCIARRPRHGVAYVPWKPGPGLPVSSKGSFVQGLGMTFRRSLKAPCDLRYVGLSYWYKSDAVGHCRWVPGGSHDGLQVHQADGRRGRGFDCRRADERGRCARRWWRQHGQPRVAHLLGAAVFGMLFGHGLFGGLGGLASFFGLILQIGLVLIIGGFLWKMWQRRQQQPAYAGGPTGSPMLREGSGSGFGGSGFGAAPGGGGTPSAPIEITPADYDAFERLLGDIQAVYSNEDLNGLRQHLTPEMVSYFSEQLSENVSRGVVNKVSNVKLLQGDLAEAWRENGVDYASVAMRYALVDRFLDRTSGRLVDGSETPEEVTEVWTFMRAGGGHWLLSAIQQT